MIRRSSTLIAIAVTLALGAAPAWADTYFVANLTGAQEVPANASTATGFGRVTLNSAETQITVSVYYSGLGSNLTAGHVHGPAAAGVNGPVLFNLLPTVGVTSGSVVGATFAVSPTQVANLKAGLHYINIHSSNLPGGEIRGQLLLAPPQVVFMSPDQEVPAAVSAATGRGVVHVNAASNQALVSVSWAGLTGPATAGHLHSARSGVNGPVACNIVPPAAAAGSIVDFLCTFSGAQMTALRQGQFYINIHTSAFPGGELRGQIQQRRATRDSHVDFDGDGNADYAIVRNNTTNGTMDWWILLSDGGVSVFSFGPSSAFSTNRILSADFDGDGRADPAYFQNQASPDAGLWILQSTTGTARFEQFGTTGDDPRVAADYDGDGRADVAIFRTLDDTWWVRPSANNAAGTVFARRWGTTFPNPGDHNGDGLNDYTDQQAGVWWTLFERDFNFQLTFLGTGASFGVPGDYDGDGKTDTAVTQTEGTQNAWYYLSSANPAQSPFATREAWGPSTGRVRVQADYDGDGKSDYAVWTSAAPSAFWILKSTGGFTYVPWGITTDFPVAGFNNR